MRKYILTSFIVLMTFNAYGAFDFENYVPTLDNLYATDSNTYIPSGYVLHFLNYQPNDTWREVPYYTYTDKTLTYSPYYYRFALNSNREQNFDLTSNVVLDDTNNSVTGYFINTNDIFSPLIKNKGQQTHILGDFVGNHVSCDDVTSCGIIRNTQNKTISDITGDFVGNHVNGSNSGIIYNDIYNQVIGTITGNFIGNIHTTDIQNHSQIVDIIGNFVNNNTVAIRNNELGTITNIITSNFIGNSKAILNFGTINNITGVFIGNSLKAIDNSGTIDNITGDFIGNSGYHTYYTNCSTNICVGAIYNSGTINNITGNFIRNNAIMSSMNTNNTNKYAAITSSSLNGLNFVSNTDNYIISDNYLDVQDTNIRYDYAIRITPKNLANNYVNVNLSFTNNNSTHYTINDEIYGVNYNLVIGGDNTGYTTFNNNIDNVNIVNINSGKMKFGKTPSDYTGTADTGRFNVINPTMNLNNGTFDVANGYTETITLNNLVSIDNNTIKIDLDINNNVSDVIISENTIQGQINLAVSALSNLDLDDTIVWFAYANNDYYSIVSADTFVLSSIDNLSYDLDIVFDIIETKWGLQKSPNSTYVPDEPENPDNSDNTNNPDTPNKPENPDNTEPEHPENPENPNDQNTNSGTENSGNEEPGNQGENQGNSEEPTEPTNTEQSENSENPSEPEEQNDQNTNSGTENSGNEEQGSQSGNTMESEPDVPVLSVETIQMVDYTASTIKHTVQKLTNSMQKRVGELQWLLKDNDNSESDLNNAFWTRGIYKNFDTNNTSVGLSGLEFGYDRIISSCNNYKWYIGGLGYISGGDSKFKNANMNISGYGLGAYLMVLEKSGWFADAVLRQHFINIDASDVKTDYTATSLNMEIGKEFVFGENEDTLKWFAKPSIEGSYISISGTKIGNYDIKSSNANTVSFSLLAGPRWDFEDGRKFQAYGKIGYNLDNSDDVDVVVNNVGTKQTVFTDTVEMGAGFDYRGSGNMTNIYMQASYITGTDYSEISGNLGLRYAF